MKQATLDKAKRAMALMNEGVTFTKASKAVKMKPRSLKKALKKLMVYTRKIKGRRRIVERFYKERVDFVIYYMMGGWSATSACSMAGTTIGTMKKMVVKLTKSNRKVKLLSKKGSNYRLNVFKVNGYHTVFYGKLMSLGEYIPSTGQRLPPIPITGTKYPGPPERESDNISFDDPNYYNVMWQLDFDPFHSTLLAEDVIEIYPGAVLKGLHANLVDSLDLFTIFHNCTGFSDEIYCGIDDRGTVESYMTPTEFRRTSKRSDTGYFEVIVRSRKGDAHYPDPPLEMAFNFDLKKELKRTRRRIR